MTKKYKSRIARVVHEWALDAFKAGVMDKATMRKFDESCLFKVDALNPAEILALRERENVSQAVLARHLNVTTGLISQCCWIPPPQLAAQMLPFEEKLAGGCA